MNRRACSCLVPLVALLGLGLFGPAGCGFDPGLPGSGYVPCDPAWGCLAPCTCSSSALVCLPGPGVDRQACQAIEPPSPEHPGGLGGLPWEDPAQALDLEVSTPLDEDDITAVGDPGAMLAEAQAGGEGLSLREALRVAKEAWLPVRIRFRPGSFGAGRPIQLGQGLPTLSGAAVLLDGRGDEVVVEARLELPGGTPGLIIEGEVVVVTRLLLRGFSGPGVEIRGAQGVLLAGVRATGNTVGVRVGEGSQMVSLGDGAELAGGQDLGGCELVGNTAGLRVVGTTQAPVSRVTLYASRVADNEQGGVSLSGALERIAIGPPPGRDALGLRGNRIEAHGGAGPGAGVVLDSANGEILVRGNLFQGNVIDVRANESVGELWMLHNSSVGTEVALLKVYGAPGAGGAALRVHLFNHASLGSPSEHFFCNLTSASQLEIEAGHILSDQADFICRCEEACPALIASAPAMHFGVGNALVACDEAFCLPEGSPGIDGGLLLPVWDGECLDLNGPAADAFCGGAPDIGARETCE